MLPYDQNTAVLPNVFGNQKLQVNFEDQLWVLFFQKLQNMCLELSQMSFGGGSGRTYGSSRSISSGSRGSSASRSRLVAVAVVIACVVVLVVVVVVGGHR